MSTEHQRRYGITILAALITLALGALVKAFWK